ncbi:MAG: hypothetical protein GVY23_09275 [Spirochaetes bacterium]|jgi:hypothetical protein|nr:hypothetical protein [Spirochaetota bacterium]
MHTSLRFLVLLFGFAVLLTACGDSDRRPSTSDAETAPAYSFNVDPDLLGEQYADRALGIRLSPPAEWTEAPASLREEIAQQLSEGTDIADAESALRALFVERSSGSALVVYEPLERDDPGAVFDQWVGPAAESAEFRHNGLNFYQARAFTEGSARFTLVTEPRDGTVAVIQYILPQSRFQEIGRSIESSIGSIEPFDGGS